MPILLAEERQEYVIQNVGGNSEAKQFLGKLGFTPGTAVTIVSKSGENLIVKILDSRIAISKEMAGKVIVS